jgi:hypothetical protein
LTVFSSRKDLTTDQMVVKRVGALMMNILPRVYNERFEVCINNTTIVYI